MASFGRPILQAAAVETTIAALRPKGRATKGADSPLNDPTEEQLWRIHDQLGEISFPARVLSNVARLVSYYPAVTPTSTDDASQPVEVDDPAVLRVWDDIGGGDQIAAWVSDLVVHYFVVGRAWLAATRIEGGMLRLTHPDEADAAWEILSTGDLKAAAGIDRLSDLPANDSRFWMLYQPSKQRRSRPDSPVRSVRFDCELLILYKHDMHANTVGRAAAGIKTLPERLRFERLDNGKTWEQQLIEDLTAGKIPGSAASQFPLFAWVDSSNTVEAEIINAAPVKLADSNAVDDLLEKMTAARQSIAVGLDIVPEILTGLGGVNHWTAWLVERSNYDHHLDPMVVRILKDLTGWWRARLAAAGIGDTSRHVLWRNPDSAIANPNSWEQTTWLYDRYLIDGETARNAADVGEVAEPTDDEIQRRLVIAALSNPAALAAFPALAAKSGIVDPAAPGSIPQSMNPASSDDMPEPVIQAATQSELDRIARRLAMVDQTLIAEAEQAVGREAARLRRNLQARIAAAARAAGLTVSDDETIAEELGVTAVLALLGLPDVAALVTADTVNVDRVDRAIGTAQESADAILRRAGATPPPTRDADRAAGTRRVAASVAAAVAESVFGMRRVEGEGGPDIVPFADVRRALDAAGGGDAARSVDGEEAWELVGNGRHTVTALIGAGVATTGFRWVYGTTPRQTFEPHLNLDGDVFNRWDDPILDQSGTGGEWVGGTHFYPGDHRGCRCTYERVLADRAGIVSLAASLRR